MSAFNYVVRTGSKLGVWLIVAGIAVAVIFEKTAAGITLAAIGVCALAATFYAIKRKEESEEAEGEE